MDKEYFPSHYAPYKILILAALTPIHVGEGRGEGVVDLVVQKDPIFEIPKPRGTSIKGSIKNMLRNLGEKVEDILGSDPERTPTIPGKVMILDAKLLLFPVRSSQGLFNYVTSTWTIQELNSLAKIVDVELPIIDEDSKVIYATKKFKEGIIYFFNGELSYEIKIDNKVDKLAQRLKEKLRGILSPYLLSRIDYLLLANHEVFAEIVNAGLIRVARIRIDPTTKTVEEGALFYQELVPEYSVFYSYILKTPRAKQNIDNIMKKLCHQITVIGGDETVGRGLVKLGLLDVEGGDACKTEKS